MLQNQPTKHKNKLQYTINKFRNIKLNNIKHLSRIILSSLMQSIKLSHSMPKSRRLWLQRPMLPNLRIVTSIMRGLFM